MLTVIAIENAVLLAVVGVIAGQLAQRSRRRRQLPPVDEVEEPPELPNHGC